MNPVLSLAAWLARMLPEPIKRSLYNVKPVADVVRSGLNRAAPQELTTVRVASGALAGARLSLDLHTEKDYWLGTYEVDLQAAIMEFVKPGMVAYDVGANIGYISLLLARRVGEMGQVFAFEALPANLDRLRGNLVLNDMQDRVQVVPAAVVERERRVSFLVGPSTGTGKVAGSAGRQEMPYDQSVDVRGLSLDDFVYKESHPAPQAVKIDIEGGEVLAIPGMECLLREAKPVVFLELHGPESAEAAWNVLDAAGYRVCRMAPGYPEVQDRSKLDWKSYLVAING